MAKFLMELCLPEYSMLEFHPSKIAAAALYISMQLYGAGEWVRFYCVYLCTWLVVKLCNWESGFQKCMVLPTVVGYYHYSSMRKTTTIFVHIALYVFMSMQTVVTQFTTSPKSWAEH